MTAVVIVVALLVWTPVPVWMIAIFSGALVIDLILS